MPRNEIQLTHTYFRTVYRVPTHKMSKLKQILSNVVWIDLKLESD